MDFVKKHGGWFFGILAIGLAVGVYLGDRPSETLLFPEIPVEAVATSSNSDYLMSTGYVDMDHEALFYLDYLNGNLTAAVLNRRSRAFQEVYHANVAEDLQRIYASQQMSVALPKNPKFMMVTGLANITTPGGINRKPGKSMLYVAEINTGIVMVYMVPWSGYSNLPEGAQRLELWTYRQMGVPQMEPRIESSMSGTVE